MNTLATHRSLHYSRKSVVAMIPAFYVLGKLPCLALPSTTLPVSQPEVVIEALPAEGTAQLDAAELGQDAAADGGQAWPWRRSGLGRAAGSFSPRAADAAGTRRRAGTRARGGAGHASSGPRNGRGPARPSSAGASARRPNVS